MKSLQKLLTQVVGALKPVKKITVSEWADSYRVLPNNSAEPGRWKTSRVPYAKEIMDAFTQSGINRVAVKSAAQVSKTECLLNIVGRFASVDPCSMMVVMPTLEMAQDFSKDRLTRMIEDTKILTPLFYSSRMTAKSRDKNQTMLSKFFTGGRLVLVGANSATGLASRPIRILLCDEVDRFPASASGGEGDPISLAAKRTSTFWNKKIGLFSTPTTEGASRIDVEYLAGTQEEWRHRCPNCGEFHTLDYEQMITDFDEYSDSSGNRTVVVKSVKWRCPDCGNEFSELEIKNAEQKYFAMNPEAAANGIRSFFINGFASPWLSWKEIMQEWYEAQGDAVREQVVYNTRFGKSYRLKGEYSDENEFLRRREKYEAEIPRGVLFLTAAVDVQKNRLEYEICGWGKSETRYGILRGVILGEPSTLQTWRELDKVLDCEYHFANGRPMKVIRTFVDSGYATRSVYEYCKTRVHKGRFAIKGKGGAGCPLIIGFGKPKDASIILIMLGVDDGKQEVFSRLGISEPGEMYWHFPLDDSFFGGRGYDQIYFKQLIAERLVTKKTGGTRYLSWETIGDGRNESLDLAVYNLACMRSLRPDWENLEKTMSELCPLPEKQKTTDKHGKVLSVSNIFNLL